MSAINHFFRHIHSKIYRCWHCWGTGKHDNGETCYVCNGKGYIEE